MISNASKAKKYRKTERQRGGERVKQPIHGRHPTVKLLEAPTSKLKVEIRLRLQRLEYVFHPKMAKSIPNHLPYPLFRLIGNMTTGRKIAEYCIISTRRHFTFVDKNNSMRLA